MIKPVLKTVATVVIATLLSTAAFAQDDAAQKTSATFEAMDKNGDQQISKSEAAADKSVSDNFASMDSNGDGYLSKSEFMAKSQSDQT
ncbi:MAG: hypothetical protein ACJ8OJ_14485 [Povalibacter sp.]